MKLSKINNDQVWSQVNHKFSALSFNIETFNIRTDINYKINMLLNKWILYGAKPFTLYKHSTNLNKEILCEGIHNTLTNKE